jgi:DNA excision repair protein ERCC-3
MANSQTVTGRFDQSTVADLETYAEERGISKSKALAELVENGIDLAGDGDTDMQLTTDGELQQLADIQEEASQLAQQVEQKVEAQKQQLEAKMADHFDLGDLEAEHVRAFADQPFNVLPKGDEESNEYYVTAPRFVPFHVGHLLEQDDAWNTFVVNKYVSWIEDVPAAVREKIDLGQRYEQATVDQNDRLLELADEAERDRAWDDLGGRDGGLNKRVDDDKIQIQKGKEFEVIAELVEAGNLPFEPRGPDADSLRDAPDGLTLKPYQERAFEQFVEHGQIGVYWPPGLGKTFLSLYAGERVAGEKLVVVPSSTLESQWQERIAEFCDHPDEWTVKTYQYLTQHNNMDEFSGVNSPKLTIFDECHTLPANTFSKLATLDTDYRIGLSATPYREDERTDYIFALTGVPVGIEWQELLEYGDFDYPAVSVYLYRTQRQKRADLDDLTDEPGKTLVFCDSIDAGERLSEELGVPFVNGETPKSQRMDLFRDNRLVIGSRVADEGLSLDTLDRVIEYDFHGGSRRQELQRAGRVMHSEDIGQHIIQMTDDEYDDYGSRLYSLEEKGMDIEFVRRA